MPTCDSNGRPQECSYYENVVRIESEKTLAFWIVKKTYASKILVPITNTGVRAE